VEEERTTKSDDNLASVSQKDAGKMHFFQDQLVRFLDYIPVVYFNDLYRSPNFPVPGKEFEFLDRTGATI
jgi:hypothetical protein